MAEKVMKMPDKALTEPVPVDNKGVDPKKIKRKEKSRGLAQAKSGLHSYVNTLYQTANKKLFITN